VCLEEHDERITSPKVFIMSARAVSPETVTIKSNKHCLCEVGFGFVFRHSCSELSCIPHHSQCKNMYALGLREKDFSGVSSSQPTQLQTKASK
jgi:hypothetical protein